ncbi:MAG: GNAT family N-acetyltransferase [Pyrinomonadaceae bacterium]
MFAASEITPIVLRDIDSIAEMRAIEDLQIEAWGDAERDIVPLNQLVASRYVGGSLIGAFDNEKLAGFVYGFYGHVRGRPVHHSHMLAVLPTYRNHNLGFRLKAAQRERVLADRLTNRVTWTFDPLQSLNTYFNFGKLGVMSDTYKINVYGEQGASFLHQNGTDRLFVTWILDSPRIEQRIAGDTPQKTEIVTQLALPMVTNSESNSPESQEGIRAISAADFVSIEIPADISSVERADFELARRWREETRAAFTEALAAGFTVTDYYLKTERTGIYLLKKMSLDDVGL